MGNLNTDGNFIVSRNDLKIRPKNNGIVTIESKLELVKTSEIKEKDFWTVVEKPQLIPQKYEDFKACIINPDGSIVELNPHRRSKNDNPTVFEHYIDFEKKYPINSTFVLEFSYTRLIHEIITEKGLLFRNRMILYVSSYGVLCERLTVQIIPNWFEKIQSHKCENIHAVEEKNKIHFYAEKIVNHQDFVIQQFLTRKLIPYKIEMFMISITTGLIGLYFRDKIIDSISKFFDLLKKLLN